MRQFLFTALEAAIASVVLIPLFLWLNRRQLHSVKKTLLYLLFAVYLSGVYAVVGLPNVTYIRLELNLNLILFREMLSSLSDTVLNVVLFLPLGIFLTLLWKPFQDIRQTFFFGLGLSLSIELLQIFTFRATDINDLLTNTSGTLLGWGFGRLILKLASARLPEGSKQELVTVFGSVFLVMFFVHPFLSNLVWTFLM